MVNGIPGVRAMFKRKAAAVVARAKEAARQGGEEVASSARYLAPRDEADLIRSIRVEDVTTRKAGNGEVGFIGVAVRAGDETTVVTNSRGMQFQNALIQEGGTRNMPANPYFNPAWRANKSRVRGRITRAIRKAWIG